MLDAIPVDMTMTADNWSPDTVQTTLAAPFEVTGPATYKKGNSSTLRFAPAPPDTGWKIKRTDQAEQLPVDVFTGNVWTAKRNIVLRSGSPHNYLRMSEHIIAHRLGMNLDNVVVSTSTGDPPLFDVGSMPIVDAIRKVGVVKQDAATLRYRTVRQPVAFLGPHDSFLLFLPDENASKKLTLDVAIDFPTVIGKQRIVFDLTPEAFAYGAHARTNCSRSEMLLAKTVGMLFADTQGRMLSGNEAGLRGYWPLDEGNGSNILNRVTGVSCKNVVAEPIWSLLTLPPVARTPQGTNTEAVATFADDCLTGVDTGTNVTTASYTLEAWVRFRGSEKVDACIASQFKNAGMGANMLFCLHGNKLAHLQDGHASTWLYGNAPLPHNRWVHVAYVQDGSLRRLYVDGELDAEADDGVVVLPEASEPLRIGYVTHLPTTHWRRWSLDGSLADVRFWNCARTAKEIAKFRTHRMSGKELGLVGYWPLNDGANGTVANLARGGTPGTAFVVWDSLDDLSFGEPLKLGFSIIVR